MKFSEFTMEGAAHQLGTDGVSNLVENAERFCAFERQRMELANEGPIVRLQGQNQVLFEAERGIALRLQSAPPPGSVARLRRRAIFYWFLTIILTVAGFAFTQLTFAPFRLGWKGWLYSAGIAVVTPYLVDRLLEGRGMEKLMKTLTAMAAVAAIVCLMLFAAIRGYLFMEEIRSNQASSIIIDDDTQTQAEPQNAFYERTLGLLRLAMILLAFAMETGAGLALHDARRSVPDDSEDWMDLRKQLAQIRNQRCELAHQTIMLRNEPRMFAARFWRDFSRAMLANTVRNVRNTLPVILFMLFALSCVRTHAEVRSNTVIAIDLSESVGKPGPDGKTDFEKNVDGVTRLLAQVTGGASVTVIGITDHSYAQPYILLSARIPEDSGYFGERLTAARAQLVRAWKQHTLHLIHSFPRTDILGALQLAEDIFAREPNAERRTLVIFSDMRQNTRDLSLECVALVPSLTSVNRQLGAIPAFKNVQAYALGVDGTGRSAAYWQSLRRFWIDYFHDAGASLVTYSVLREAPRGAGGIFADRIPQDPDPKTGSEK